MRQVSRAELELCETNSQAETEHEAGAASLTISLPLSSGQLWTHSKSEFRAAWSRREGREEDLPIFHFAAGSRQGFEPVTPSGRAW